MLTLYRRHTKSCSKGYKQYDRSGDKCNCMIHVEGKLEDSFLRQSTGTRSITRARKLLVEAEERGTWGRVSQDLPEINSPGIVVSYVISEFLKDRASTNGRNLTPTSLGKYRTLLARLEVFLNRQGIEHLQAITYQHLKAFQSEWKTGPEATTAAIVKLRSLWRFAEKNGYALKNVASELELPRNFKSAEKTPFTNEEMARILASARTIRFDIRQPITNQEAEAFILLMRYSGMAISDASLFRNSELIGDEVRYRRKKTEKMKRSGLIVVPVPGHVASKLKELPILPGGYLFCHGANSRVLAANVWHVRIRQILKQAGVKGSSHQFRHTFATDLLTKGVSIELVSKWLGHSSVRVTESFYSHFTENRIQAASNVLRELYRSGETSL